MFRKNSSVLHLYRYARYAKHRLSQWVTCVIQQQNPYICLTFSQIFSTCHLSSGHVFEKSYNWHANVFKVEGYSFNINADYRLFPEASHEEIQRRIFNNKTLKTVKHTDHIVIFFVTGSISFKTFDRKNDYKLCGRLSFVDFTVNLTNFVILNMTWITSSWLCKLISLRNLKKRVIYYFCWSVQKNIFLVRTSMSVNNIYIAKIQVHGKIKDTTRWRIRHNIMLLWFVKIYERNLKKLQFTTRLFDTPV